MKARVIFGDEKVKITFDNIKNDEIVVLCIILEWMTHKRYERRFHYG